MHKKFLIFMDRDWKYSIHLAMVDFHRDIEVPENTAARCGGGWWEVTKDGTLRLYGSSEDFGKYEPEHAEKAFEDKAVFYYGDNCFEEGEFKSLKTE